MIEIIEELPLPARIFTAGLICGAVTGIIMGALAMTGKDHE